MIISTFGFFTDRKTKEIYPLSLHARLFSAQSCIGVLDLLMAPGAFMPESVTKRGYDWKHHKNALSSRVALRIYEDFCRAHAVYLFAYHKNESSLIQLQQKSGLSSTIRFEPLLKIFDKTAPPENEQNVYKDFGLTIQMNASADIHALQNAYLSLISGKSK